MKGKVLLIVHDVYQDDNDFPLGIAYLASVLRKEGHDITVYCQDVFHYLKIHLSNFLESTRFDLIGLGFLAARFKETVAPLCEKKSDGVRDDRK
jgi:hypothetical protein